MYEKQRTIKHEISMSGIGLHTGNACTMTCKPAPPETGIRFVRADLPDKPSVIADIDHVVDISRGTTLQDGEARVHTVEHVLAAFAGLQKRDVITGINNQPVRSLEDFNTELKKHNLNQGIRLHVKSANGSRFVFLKND